jgi:hypothetical protein
MILIGVHDVGPARYLLALDPYLRETVWVPSAINKDLLAGKSIHQNWKSLSPDIILTGTSLGATFEKEMIEFGKERNVTTVSIIDHWSWFHKRFEIDGNVIWPDHIVVNDQYARAEAIHEGIPEVKLFIGGNPLLEKLAQAKLNPVDQQLWRRDQGINYNRIVLFIAEELKSSFAPDTEDDLGYDEYLVLESIINLKSPDDLLLIKLHPEEDRTKYDAYLSREVQLAEDWSIEMMAKIPDYVIGMASMLLLELSLFRSDVISYRPNAKKAFIGENLGATHPASDHSQMSRYFQRKPELSTLSFREKYEGSGNRIAHFLEKL